MPAMVYFPTIVPARSTQQSDRQSQSRCWQEEFVGMEDGAGYEVGQKRQMVREVCENWDKQPWLKVDNKNVEKRSPQTIVVHLKGTKFQ